MIYVVIFIFEWVSSGMHEQAPVESVSPTQVAARNYSSAFAKIL